MEISSIPHIGEILALLTAIIWAVAVILFKKSGETVHPIALNLFKNSLGAVLIVPTIVIIDGNLSPEFSSSEVSLLLVSGALGIGIADTLFFMSLNRLGAALSSIVDCLYSPMVITAAVVWLGERLTVIQVVGVVLIISAVLEASGFDTSYGGTRKGIWLGVLWGIMSMAFMAVGIVIAKPMLETQSLMWIMLIRLLGGIGTLLIVLIFNRNRAHILRTLLMQHSWGYLFSASFVGAYLALITWLAGLKYTQASQASALNQTSNVFVFILAAVYLKEPMTRQRILGIILAAIGVYLVTFYSN